jgi:hypothetical protein
VHWAGLARFEWVLFDGGLIAFLVWQLISIRRLVRIDREKAQAAKAAEAAEAASSADPPT